MPEVQSYTSRVFIHKNLTAVQGVMAMASAAAALALISVRQALVMQWPDICGWCLSEHHVF